MALFFKWFITMIFAVYESIRLLTWGETPQHSISRAIYIAYDESIIQKYYSGMKMNSRWKRIIGFIMISSLELLSCILSHHNRNGETVYIHMLLISPLIEIVLPS